MKADQPKWKIIVLILILLAFLAAPLAAVLAQNNATRPAGVATVLQPNRSPLVTFRILFATGAADDPAGKEGLANLTALMIAAGGTRGRTYEEITNSFYPIASNFGAQVDKEMTVFTGTTHVDNLDRYYSIISEMLLDPGFRQEDFTRLKTNAVNFLKVSLRQSNDEELGKEHLYNVIYGSAGKHPYAHHNVGTVSSLERITLDDIQSFYRRNYTRSNITLGLAGNYPATFPARVDQDLARLAAGTASKRSIPKPGKSDRTTIDIVKRETRSTGISMGFPIDVRRGDRDYAALALVASYFGQHRSSNSYLYQKLREARGLNYGDYAYIEYFPRGMFQFTPDPNLGRSSQIFQIWIRPVEPQNAHFALRAALYEFDNLVRNGMSAETFEATREFLGKYSNILTQTQDAQLGYALDSRYYNTPAFNSYMRGELQRLTLADVNSAIKRHLGSDRPRVVMVTRDADALRNQIITNTASPITYNSPKPELAAEDKIIESYRIDVRPEDVRVVPVEQLFE